MKKSLLILSLLCGFAVLPAAAADKGAKEHTAKDHAAKDRPGKEHPNAHSHADQAGDADKGRGDKEKCAEMMAHNNAAPGESADSSKKGCGMGMGKKKGVKKHQE